VEHVTRHGYAFRFTLFALIGGLVFIAGLALQVALVRYANVGADWSYTAQAIFSIELSYLLNRYLTWRDRSAGFWAAAWKFNAQKLLMTVVNLAAYALLIRAGMEYIVANVVLTAIFTPVNYFAADLLVFVRGKRTAEPEHVIEARLPKVLPTVSIVIPCKGSERTIRGTVDSFLGQDYPALSELILVGDVNDSTWKALADVKDSRLVIIEQEHTPGRRDPNVKRDKGIKKSAGDVIALADSDIVVDPGWLGRAIGLLNGQGGGLVAGGIRSINDTFWGRFVDNNVMAAKTPRVQRPYRVTAQNFGARGYKPPITANAIFTRDLYDLVQLDTGWAYGYEDYEWFWRLARDGHPILFASELTASHHHRRSFRQLVREYHQSAHGCAQFIRAHPESPLARKRAVQAFGLPTLALGAAILATLAAVAGYGTLVAGLLAMAAVLVTGREVARARSLEGLTYAPAALALGGVYAATIAGNLIRPSARRVEAPTWDDSGAATGVRTLERPAKADRPPPERAAEAPSRHRSPRRHRRLRVSWPLVAILAVQTGMSLGLVWSNTIFGDEATYLTVGRLEWSHWLDGTPLPAAGQANFGFVGTFQSYFSGAPQIYPPIGAAMNYLGGLAAARILGLAFMLGACGLLYLTTKRLFGRRTALFAAGLWAVSAPTLRLAFATYDPMAIFLVCLGTWLAVESGYRRHRAELITAAGLVLALGAVTAYSYAIFVPASIVVAITSWAPRLGWKRSLTAGSWLTALCVVLLGALPTVLKVWQGVLGTTLARSPGDSGVLSVARTSWELSGLIAVLAVIGALVAVHSRCHSGHLALLAFCALAAFAVPAEQVRLETATSLDKHLAMGAWFAAVAAGYALSQLTSSFRLSRRAALACASAAIAFPAVNGWSSAFQVYHLWPDASPYITAMRPLVAKTNGNVLVVQYSSTTEYYLGNDSNWERWTSVSLDPSYASATPAHWTSYYRTQVAAASPELLAVPFDIAFTQQNAGELLLTNLTNSLKSGKQAAVRKVLLQIAASDVSSGEPGLYDLSSVIATDAAYRVVMVTPYNSHIASGVFVVWKHVPVAPARSHAPAPHEAHKVARAPHTRQRVALVLHIPSNVSGRP
jgi:putative flippase GtrA/4-amino-4-deoxy-L-arabinose transferase-like glycosyltransferase/GT2 family glycosyltransferase